MRETIKQYFELQTELRNLQVEEDNEYISVFGVNALFGKLLVIYISLYDSSVIVSMDGMQTSMDVTYLDDEVMTDLNNYLRILISNIKVFIKR